MSTTIQDVTRVDPSAQLIGQKIDKYQIVQLVGRGGMGRVYEAINTSINKRVAMKLIDGELAKNDEANARFQREALAASAVESPYIVQIFDAGSTADGLPYIVMELLRGQDLGGHITEQGRLDVVDSLLVIVQILKGLHHAHGAGIVHRDLKPDNVFLVEREDEPVTVKLLDFGVSKIAATSEVPLETLTRQGAVVGTPYYMSPEQAQAFPDVDGQADLYSVGAILYECLTGRPPHIGKSYEQVIVNICMKDASDVRELNPEVPDGVAMVLSKALSREREDRFGSAREMLDAVLEHAPEGVKAATPSSQLRASGGSLSGPGREVVTPKIISSPGTLPASELADTVHADSQGVSPPDDEEKDSTLARTGDPSTAEVPTVRSPSQPDELGLPTGPRWPLALAAAVAVVSVAALVLSTSNEDSPAENTTGAAVAEPNDTTVPTTTAQQEQAPLEVIATTSPEDPQADGGARPATGVTKRLPGGSTTKTKIAKPAPTSKPVPTSASLPEPKIPNPTADGSSAPGLELMEK
ncbi:MAG: serine/threonine protein kinase [Deltaproteobacteria bacterium]|nr:MAG: serine/threonine protein kinase [Deltaproteobacteria bacterium]